MTKSREKEIVLARPGVYGGMDNPKPVTAEDLREIAESYKQGEAVPVTVTEDAHPTGGNFPKFGEVTNIYFKEQTEELVGTLTLNPELQRAMDGGYYDNWSIGAKTGADGKLYLHHLAFLGETPPAIKGLRQEIMQSLNMADDFITPCYPWKESRLASAIQKVKAHERRQLEEAMAYKVPFTHQGRVLELADQLAGREIRLSDGEGRSTSKSIYEALSGIFQVMPAPVKEGVYLSDSDEDEFNKPIKNILNKA